VCRRGGLVGRALAPSVGSRGFKIPSMVKPKT